MIHLKLRTEFRPDREVQAWVEHNGEQIDSHYHSSENWLLSDWGFCGSSQGDNSSHEKKITEKLKTADWELTYKALDGKIYKLTPLKPKDI